MNINFCLPKSTIHTYHSSMSTLRNRTVLTVAAFMLSAVQSSANETCAANVNACTPLQLCEASTSSVNGQKVWSSDPAFADHVSTSQQLGINCGVVEVVQATCQTDANLCTVVALCEQATQMSASGSTRTWSVENVEHARLARQFGLTCGVGETAAADPSLAVDDEDLCGRATFLYDGRIMWRGGLLRREAEGRGLNCNVGRLQGGHVIDTDDERLCARATKEIQGMVLWNKDSAANTWRFEAQARGLTCSVGERVVNPNASFCARATNVADGKINWREGILRSQAEERGLTCNVGMTVGDQAILGSPSASTDELVCARSTQRQYPGTVVWNGDAWSEGWRNEAERRGLTCGVDKRVENQSDSASDMKLCPANGHFFHDCFGPWTERAGNTYVGSWFDGSLQGVATVIYGPGEWQEDVQIGMTSDGRITGGQALYIWRSGHVRFEWSWDSTQSYSSNSDVNSVFPSLTSRFQNLPREQRIAIQRSLARKGLYDSTIDGVWGRNTLIGIARFTGEHLNTVNLRSTENVIVVLDAIRAQVGLDRTAKASSEVLRAVMDRDAVAAAAANNTANFRQAFTSQTLLRRQQLQYALRALGFYSSSIDGLWGNGTSSAIVGFVEANGGTGRDPERIFRDILGRVDVPSSFAAPRPNTTSNGVASAEARIEQICRRRADQARRVARNNHRPSNTSTSVYCRPDFFGNYDCSASTGISGGMWGGILAGMEAADAGRAAYDLEYETCMIQLGN